MSQIRKIQLPIPIYDGELKTSSELFEGEISEIDESDLFSRNVLSEVRPETLHKESWEEYQDRPKDLNVNQRM